MKKFLVIIMCLLFTIGFSVDNYKSVKAEEIEFENFNFSSSKIRKNGKIKVRINIDWVSEYDIQITSITTIIKGQTQKTLNLSKNKELLDDNLYHYTINYDVEHWQIGTMILQINYFNVEDGENLVNEYYVPGGKWMEEEVSWTVAISFGLFVTFCIAIVTYSIIESSKKGYFGLEVEA